MRRLRPWVGSFFATLTLAVLCFFGPRADASGGTKHIVLIAGAKSHGEGEHEYWKTVRLLKALLDRAPNLRGSHIKTEISSDGWPRDATVLDRADVIAFFSDGEHVTQAFATHSPFMTPKRLQILAREMRRGCGFVIFHGATFSDAERGSQMLNWLGAYFDYEHGRGEGGRYETDGTRYGIPDLGEVRNWHSALRVLDTDVRIATSSHPIVAGVSNFHLKDEFYYRLRTRPHDARLTPILVVPALAPKPEDQMVAWALLRRDGGRSFGTSSGHYYDDWRNDEYRKLILNALVWTSGNKVPAGGVQSRFMSDDEVDRALAAELPVRQTMGAGDPAETVESAAERAQLPLYKIIPAATDAQLTPAAPAASGSTHREWFRSNADLANSRYSALNQINRENVAQLEPVWTYHSGGHDSNDIQTSPVIVDGVLYAPAIGQMVVALNAETGAELWRFKPPAATEIFGEGWGPAHRGLLYWGGERRIAPRLFFTGGGYLYALDPRTGQPIPSFGENGRVRAKGPVAPVVYRSTIVASDLAAVAAFDAVTGKTLWRFETAVEENKQAVGYWVENGARVPYPGGSVWSGMALDESRGLVFAVTGSPHPNLVGINRLGDDKYTNSVVTLDARTGRLLWAFQDIAHDLWDLDVVGPPDLVTVTLRGKRVDAVATVTKQGNTLLLDRTSGKPLYPFRLRRAPTSTVPGEVTAAYQPDLELPEPFSRQEFTPSDITTLTPEAREFVLKKLQGVGFGWFQPPMEHALVAFYGVHGGAEWTGAAFDPISGLLYVSSNELVKLAGIAPVKVPPPGVAAQVTPGQRVFREHCSMCHGEHREGVGVAPPLLAIQDYLTDSQVIDIIQHGKNAMPPRPMSNDDRSRLLDFLFGREEPEDQDVPGTTTVLYDSYLAPLLDDQGHPGIKPPWGTLNAIDLNTGKIVWKVPLGEYEELTRRGVPKTGTENFGGATVTAGGLVFCAGTQDLKIRAFDKATGVELWQHALPYGGYSPPATYEVKGRQYVVIAATGGGKLGGQHGDAYVAFALPR
jgi:quinoprotein glucose dehydrogenase